MSWFPSLKFHTAEYAFGPAHSCLNERPKLLGQAVLIRSYRLLFWCCLVQALPSGALPRSRHMSTPSLNALLLCSSHPMPCPKLSKSSSLITSLSDPKLILPYPIACPTPLSSVQDNARCSKSSSISWELVLGSTVWVISYNFFCPTLLKSAAELAAELDWLHESSWAGISSWVRLIATWCPSGRFCKDWRIIWNSRPTVQRVKWAKWYEDFWPFSKVFL